MDLLRYRTMIASCLANAEVTTNQILVVFSTLVGEHKLGGDVGVLFRKLHDLYLGSDATKVDLLNALRHLAALDDDTLQRASRAKRLHAIEGPLAPHHVSMHCSMCDDDGPDDDDPNALWVALYGPAYLLGWTGLVGAERALLVLPLTLEDGFDPADLKARTAEAISLAQRVYPTLALDAEALDYGSRTRFGWSLSHALYTQAAHFDPRIRETMTTTPASKKAAKKKPAAPPDMAPMETLLFERTTKALKAWTKANPGAQLAQLSFDGTPPHGNVGICFDSADNHAATIAAQDAELAASGARLEYGAWALAAGGGQWADRFEAGLFSDHYVAEVKLPKYERFAGSADAPEAERPGRLSWADGTLRVLFVRVIARLVAEGALALTPRAPTVYLGFTMHDERPVVVQTLTG